MPGMQHPEPGRPLPDGPSALKPCASTPPRDPGDDAATAPPDTASGLLPGTGQLALLEPIQRAFAAYQAAAFGDRPPAFFALELCGEAGELANIEKKLWRRRQTDPADRADHLADEAADVLIAILNYANARGINLAEVVPGKLARIDQRRLSGEMGPPR